MRNRTCSIATATLATVVLVAGCGGASEPGGPVTAEAGSLSKRQFIERADDICAERVKESATAVMEYLKENGLEPTTRDALDHAPEIVDAVLPALQEQIDQLRSLGAPPGDVMAVSAILTAMQWNVDEGEAKPQKFLTSEGSFATPAELAKEYGLAKCAQS